ncbi:hypothetical protein P5673_011361 [Acropora cervicornis]|uniref:Uncharacterized protein n=1 Tax=Acropora cervicornis TaxID=6130 RepID=A0AAD9QQQ3_ACRCE|nr:hypothetical protein P5673_011361 [Acropora cervicornis]
MSMEVITLAEVSRAGLRLLSLSKIAAHETVPLGLDHLGVGSSIGDNSVVLRKVTHLEEVSRIIYQLDDDFGFIGLIKSNFQRLEVIFTFITLEMKGWIKAFAGAGLRSSERNLSKREKTEEKK